MGQGVCVVTGGGRGIGAAIARRAVQAGWTVCLSYRVDGAAAERLSREIDGVAWPCDTTQEADVVALFKAAAALGPITAVVANAGIVAPPLRVDEYSIERVRHLFDVNVLGTILTAREAIRRMSTRHGGPGGSLVLIGSAASRIGSPNEYVDYAATKGAVDTFTIGLAKEVATEGVRVNCVRPGIIDTTIHASGGQPDRVERLSPQVPLQRAGTADEVAASVEWLLSDASSYVTGALIDVAGGR